MNYISLIDLGITFIQQFLNNMKNKAPSEVVAAIQAALDAILLHRNDVLTKANFESARG